MINREKTQALGNHELQRQLIISYNVTWQETAVHGREMDPDGGGGGGVLLLSTTLLPAETIPRQCKTQVDNAWGQFKQVCAKS